MQDDVSNLYIIKRCVIDQNTAMESFMGMAKKRLLLRLKTFWGVHTSTSHTFGCPPKFHQLSPKVSVK